MILRFSVLRKNWFLLRLWSNANGGLSTISGWILYGWGVFYECSRSERLALIYYVGFGTSYCGAARNCINLMNDFEVADGCIHGFNIRRRFHNSVSLTAALSPWSSVSWRVSTPLMKLKLVLNEKKLVLYLVHKKACEGGSVIRDPWFFFFFQDRTRAVSGSCIVVSGGGWLYLAILSSDFSAPSQLKRS